MTEALKDEKWLLKEHAEMVLSQSYGYLTIRYEKGRPIIIDQHVTKKRPEENKK